jgi:hypothetical protein
VSVFQSEKYQHWLFSHLKKDAVHRTLNSCCRRQTVFRSAEAVQEALGQVSEVFSPKYSKVPNLLLQKNDFCNTAFFLGRCGASLS